MLQRPLAMTLPFGAILLFWSAPSAPPEQPQGPSPERIAALVEQLGDDSYEVRERASGQLVGLGLAASDALVAGMQHDDAEVRRRCRWILARVKQIDFRNRLDAFLADESGSLEHDLPGWSRYRRVIGTDRAARQLFAEMQQAEAGLLESAAAGPAAAADGLRLRIRQVYQLLTNRDRTLRRPPSLATTAALVFVGSDPSLEAVADPATNMQIATLVQQADFRKALSEGPNKVAVHKIVGQWLLAPSGEDTAQNLLRTKLRIAVQFEIEEGAPLALELLDANKEGSASMRAYAASTMGRVGGRKYAAVLADLLDDQSVAYQSIVSGKKLETRVADVALAWLVHLTGQDHDQYGQSAAKVEFERVSKAPGQLPNLSRLGFENDAARQKALEKWQAYVAENPLPERPELRKEERGRKGDG